MSSGDDQYHPKDAVRAAINGTMITGAAGLAVSAIQNTLTKRNVNAWGVFTRSGGTIAVFGMPSYPAKLNVGLIENQLRWEVHTSSQDLLPPIYERGMIV